jgi:hypothetical protein
MSRESALEFLIQQQKLQIRDENASTQPYRGCTLISFIGGVQAGCDSTV